MHLSRREIREALEGTITDERKLSVALAHVQECEFCAEIAEEERMIAEELLRTDTENTSEETHTAAKHLYQQSLRGSVLDLTLLSYEQSSGAGFERTGPDIRIAADSSESRTPRIENLLTLFSENPEFVLNVMRDNSTHKDYLQLSSDEPANISQALVRIAKLNTELVTDMHGHAELPQQLSADAAELNWQVVMPTAVFDLEPIVYDPEKVEYSEDVVLESDKQDRIQVTFQRKTEGSQVIIQVLELDGRTDFKHVRVALSQANILTHLETTPDNPVTFEINDKDSTIEIRLFH